MSQIQLLTDLMTQGGKSLGGVNDAAKVYPYGDFWLALSLGFIPNMERASGIGLHPDISSGGAPADAWGAAGLYPWWTGTKNLEMWCADARDTAAGTGASSVSFFTLDASGNRLTQTLATNGNGAAVPLPTAALANNGGRVMLAGTDGTNMGNIFLRDAGGGTVRGIILPGEGIIHQAPYTVPKGYTLAVRQLLLAVDSPTGGVGKFAAMTTWFQPSGLANFQPLRIGNTNGTPYNHLAEPEIMAGELSRFSLRIIKVSDNNTIVTCGWNGILRKNNTPPS